ncbi:MAG: hypothetical protein NXI04_14805 [Planctomycetaceae bacterium]|nr:hypothetical protein [Planctomycetaceae bacterium]
MKALFVAVLLVGAMVIAGWITVSNDGSSASATFDKTEVRRDTQQAINKGKDVVDDAGNAIREAGRKASSEWQDASEAAAKKLEQAGEAAEEQLKKAADAAGQNLEQAADAIRETDTSKE